MLQAGYFVEQEENVSLEQQGGTIEERIEGLLQLKDVDDDGFNPVNYQAAIDHVLEKKQKENAKGLLGLLTPKMTEVLGDLLSKGPMEDGDLSSKEGRDGLMDLSLAVAIVGKSGDKENAATMMALHLWNLAGFDEEESTDDDEE